MFNLRYFLIFGKLLYDQYTKSIQTIWLFLKLFFTDLTERFGSLFFWKVIFEPKLRASADCFKFSCTVLIQLLFLSLEAINLRKVAGYIDQEKAQKTSCFHYPDSQLEQCFRFENFTYFH